MKAFFGAVLAVGVLAIGGIFYLGDLYRRTENRNFARNAAAWEKSQKEMDCMALPIHCAVRDRKFESIDDMIARGFPKDSRDVWGNTALFYAWKWTLPESFTKVITALLEAGVDPDIGDHNGDFPLWQAIRGRKYELAALLIRHGADPNIKIGNEAKKMTLLSETVTQKDVAAAELLVKHGASVSLKDGYGYDACERARLYQTSALFSFCQDPAAERD